jgi:hypothetical protein
LSPGDGRSGVARANWAGRLDVEVRTLAVRPMSSKWASCSTAGNLNFNADLLDMDRAIGDYVIVHELLHFSVPHHGNLWKSLMRTHLGDYEKLDRKLKQSATRRQNFEPCRTVFFVTTLRLKEAFAF